VKTSSVAGVGLTKGEVATVSWATAALAKSSSVEMESDASMMLASLVTAVYFGKAKG